MQSHHIRKLNIGCGENLLEEWLNTDLIPDSRVIFLDASRPLPFADSTFNYVFSEHMVEHIDYQNARKLFREVYRILRTGGKFRVATPDLHFLIKLYSEKSCIYSDYISWMSEKWLQDFDFETDSVVINHVMHGFGHRFIYDFKLLKMVLEKVGFSDITRHSPGESNDEHLKNVEGHGKIVPSKFNDLETMVVECSKAGPKVNMA